MNTPEWKKELVKETEDRTTAINSAITNHNVANKHRTIHISTTSPANSEGANGDIWLIYEA